MTRHNEADAIDRENMREYERAMQQAIPQIVRDVRRRGALAEDARSRTMIYVIPTPPNKPFKKGDIVETVDRDGKTMATGVKIASKRGRVRVWKMQSSDSEVVPVVKTEDGREWNALNGYWIGRHSGYPREWPFPSIRTCGSEIDAARKDLGVT